MRDSLRNVLSSHNELITNCGIQLSFRSENVEGSISVNMDSPRYVGTVVYWPETQFEFQFNCTSSGDVVFLESREFTTEAELALFVEELLSNRLAL